LSFEHSPEEIKKQIKTYFESNYPSFLTQVAALWPSDVVAIEAFRDIFLGDVSKSKEIAQWPSLAIMSGDVFPVVIVEQRRTIFWHTQIYLRTFIRDTNLERLEKTLDRHLQAQLMMFETAPYATLGGIATSFEFLRSEPTDSILPLGSSIYIRALETQWEIRHR